MTKHKFQSTVRHKAPGFTLIEILIVMVIISIVGAASLMSINHNKNKQLENFSSEIKNLVILAEQQAMLQPAVLGLRFTQRDMQFYQYQEPDKESPKPTWKALSNSTFGKHLLPKDTEVTLKIQDKTIPTDTSDPHLIISTGGDLTPFIISIGEKDKPPLYRVTGTEDGSVTTERISYEK
jgi:general secretion pathway protein H